MKSIAKNFLRSKSFVNALSKRHYNEISAQTIIDPAFGLSDEDKQLQEGDFSNRSLAFEYQSLKFQNYKRLTYSNQNYKLSNSFECSIVAYNFAIKELRPNMRAWDREKYFPVKEMQKGKLDSCV